MIDKIERYLDEVRIIASLISRADIHEMAKAIAQVKHTNGRIFFAGVGGSAANCSHAVNDFRKILNIESYAITDNVSELTARINDEGWDTSFAKYLEVSSIGPEDCLFVLSVGGGSEKVSKNIVMAIDFAKAHGAKVLSIVSRNGGYSKLNSDVCVLIPTMVEERITPHAEEWQAIIWHLLVSILRS